MRDAGVVEPVSRGVYRLASLEPLAHPDLVTVAKRVPLGVLCLVSALSFHELTTQVPHAIDVALKRGTRMPRLDYRPTRFFWFSGPAFYEGIETDGAISGGHKVTAPKGAAASTLTRLRNVADAAGVSFNEILQVYAIKRFLARVSKLPDADSVLLKGAMMLRVWGIPRGRPTMDLDMLKRGAADQASLVDLVRKRSTVDSASNPSSHGSAAPVIELLNSPNQ